jgi:hypothetical protein
MGLDSVVRSVVATANAVTSSLQATVQHAAWTGNLQDGTDSFATAVPLQALVEFKQRLRRLSTGREVMQQAVVTFIGPVTANGTAGRREPIDPRDQITLPNGYSGPILDVEGLVDPSTSAPYLVSVVLG